VVPLNPSPQQYHFFLRSPLSLCYFFSCLFSGRRPSIVPSVRRVIYFPPLCDEFAGMFDSSRVFRFLGIPLNTLYFFSKFTTPPPGQGDFFSSRPFSFDFSTARGDAYHASIAFPHSGCGPAFIPLFFQQIIFFPLFFVGNFPGFSVNITQAWNLHLSHSP